MRRVDGIESANREIARWPAWKRESLFGAFGIKGDTAMKTIGDSKVRQFLPSVMVLVFEERLGHSMWMEYDHHRKRTLKSLVKHLASEVKSGRFVGYMLYNRELSITGVCPLVERWYLDKIEANDRNQNLMNRLKPVDIGKVANEPDREFSVSR